MLAIIASRQTTIAAPIGPSTGYWNSHLSRCWPLSEWASFAFTVNKPPSWTLSRKFCASKPTSVKRLRERSSLWYGMKVVSRQGDDKEFWDFVPEVKNSGMTSTKNLNYSNVGIHCMKLPNGKDIIFPEGEDPARIFYAPGVQDSGAYTRAIIGPQSKLRDDSMIGTISKNNFAALQQAFGCSDRIAASGVFIYRDTLPDTARHITKYCYISEPGADFLALCDHWNCADDECKTDAESYNKGVERAFRDAGKPVDPQFLAKPDFP